MVHALYIYLHYTNSALNPKHRAVIQSRRLDLATATFLLPEERCDIFFVYFATLDRPGVPCPDMNVSKDLGKFPNPLYFFKCYVRADLGI